MIQVNEDEYLALIKENEKLKELISTLEFCEGCESMTKVIEAIKKKEFDN